MAGEMFDSSPVAGNNDQEKEYYFRRIAEVFPEAMKDPRLLYGDARFEFYRLANEGKLPLNISDKDMANLLANPTGKTVETFGEVFGAGARKTRELAGSIVKPQFEVGDARRYGWEENPNRAANAIRELIFSRTGRVESTNRIIDDVITIPAGTWTITEIGAFMKGALSGPGQDGRRHRGLIIQGMGRFTTRIIFDPAEEGYLFDNQDRVSRILFRDISFTGGSPRAGFMNCLSNGGPQSLFFERVNWNGTWKYGLLLSGMDNNSEFNFLSCKVNGDWDTFFMVDNFQALNHNFFGTDIEINTGNAVHYKQGGHCNIFGGSWIGGLNTAGAQGNGEAFVKLDGPGGQAICRFYMEGVRFEMRNEHYMLIDSTWPTGNVSFKSVHDVGFQSDVWPNSIRARFTGNNMPIVNWEDCYLTGRHEYIGHTQPDNQTRRVTYRNTTIRSHADWEDFIVTSVDPAISTRRGGLVPVNLENCRSNMENASATLVDHTINGFLTKNAMVKKYTVSIKNGFGEIPGNTLPAGLTIKLPKGAIITKITSYAPPAAATAVSTTWEHILKDGSENILFQKGSGKAMKEGWHLEAELFHVCDTPEKRLINFSSTGQGVNETGLVLLEYTA